MPAVISSWLNSANWLKSARPTPRFMVIGHVNDVLLYRELIKAGISEYVVAPISPVSFIDTDRQPVHDPKAARWDASFHLSVPRVALVHQRLPTTWPGPHRSARTSKPSSQILTWLSALLR